MQERNKRDYTIIDSPVSYMGRLKQILCYSAMALALVTYGCQNCRKVQEESAQQAISDIEKLTEKINQSNTELDKLMGTYISNDSYGNLSNKTKE